MQSSDLNITSNKIEKFFQEQIKVPQRDNQKSEAVQIRKNGDISSVEIKKLRNQI